jgi:hypothetical protein
MSIRRRVPSIVAILCLLAAIVALQVPGIRGDAAPAVPFPTEVCPARFTTGTCVGGTFLHGTDNADDGNDGGDDAPEPESQPVDSGGSGDGSSTPTTSPPPTPEQIQAQLVQEANTYFRQPEVTLDNGRDPDVQLQSTVGVATFVEVANWQGEQTDVFEESGFVVEIHSTPHLFFDPGEPGSQRIACEDGGTRYDPNGGSVEQQASRAGACAYEYTMRTGVDGRPDEWPAEVIIEWSISWSANFPLPPDLTTSATLSEPVPRQVREVSSVIVDD